VALVSNSPRQRRSVARTDDEGSHQAFEEEDAASDVDGRRYEAWCHLPRTNVRPMALDAGVLAELKQTKAEIDRLQERLKELVAQLRDGGATAQEIAEALRS
jgi:hypothetical protein